MPDFKNGISINGLPLADGDGNVVFGRLPVAADGISSAAALVRADDSRLFDGRAPVGPATGDLAGVYPDPTVVGIRGRAIAPSVPLHGQVYWFNGVSDVWEPASLTPSPFATTIGDGSTTEFVITHNLGSRDVVVNVWETDEPYSAVTVETELTSDDEITLIFGVPPEQDAYRVVIAQGGGGAVSRVELTAPPQFVVLGNPITTAGVLDLTWAAQAAHTVLAGPTLGDPSAPTFRALVAGDLPVHVHSAADITSGSLADARLTSNVLLKSGNLAGLTDLAAARSNLGLGDVAVLNGGVANGVATLDSAGKVPQTQLPSIAVTDTFVVGGEAAMLALDAQTGDVAVRTDLNRSYILTATPASTLTNWQELLTPTDVVTSVAGRTGDVLLQWSDINNPPTTIVDYGITDPLAYTDRSNTFIAAQTIAPTAWTGSPLLQLTAKGYAGSGYEYLLRGTVDDAANAYFSLENGYTIQNAFSPWLRFYAGGSGYVSSLAAGGMIFSIPSATDSGSTPVAIFNVTRSGLAVATRPLYQWQNNNNPVLTMLPGPVLGLGITAPSGDLHIVQHDPSALYRGLIVESYGNTSGPALMLRRAQGQGPGSEAAVALDQQIGTIQMFGWDGAGWTQGGEIELRSSASGTIGQDSIPTDLIFKTRAGGALYEAMRITQDQRLGIGTTAPTAKLDVVNGYIRAREGTNTPPSSGQGIELVSTGGVGYLVSYNRDTSAYRPINVHGSLITLGNSSVTGVGIGTSSPGARLYVQSSHNLTTADIAQFLANNLTQGIGIGYNRIEGIGSGANVDINIIPKGTGVVYASSNLRASGQAYIGVHPSYGATYSAFWKDGYDYAILTEGTNVFLNAPAAGGTIYFRHANGVSSSNDSAGNWIFYGGLYPGNQTSYYLTYDNNPAGIRSNGSISALYLYPGSPTNTSSYIYYTPSPLGIGIYGNLYATGNLYVGNQATYYIAYWGSGGHITNGHFVAGGNIYPSNQSSYYLTYEAGQYSTGYNGITVVGSLAASSAILTGSWFRSIGATGWYNQTYGGGWYMSDSSWIRSYNGKQVNIDTGTGTQLQLTGNSASPGGNSNVRLVFASTANGSNNQVLYFDGTNFNIYCSQPNVNALVVYSGSGFARVGIRQDGPAYALHVGLDSCAKPNGGSWTNSSSDIRTKTVDGEYEYGLAAVMDLHLVRYTYNGRGGTPKGQKGIGFVAQEAIAVIPEMVSTRMAKLDPSDAEETELLTINNDPAIYATIKAVQELGALVEAQRQTIEDLQTQVAALSSARGASRTTRNKK